MSWTKLGGEHFDRAERLDLSRDALLLEVEALVWCNRAGTDGAIPARQMARVTTSKRAARSAQELVNAGLWLATDTGWQVVNWTGQGQMAAEEVESRRANGRVRAERQRRHLSGDHSQCNPKYCRASVSNALRVPSLTTLRTDPLRTDPTGPAGPGRVCRQCGPVEQHVTLLPDGVCTPCHTDRLAEATP